MCNGTDVGLIAWGHVWVCAGSLFHAVASPCDSFITIAKGSIVTAVTQHRHMPTSPLDWAQTQHCLRCQLLPVTTSRHNRVPEPMRRYRGDEYT